MTARREPDGAEDGFWGHEPARPGMSPLLARLGAILLVGVVLFPVAASLRAADREGVMAEGIVDRRVISIPATAPVSTAAAPAVSAAPATTLRLLDPPTTLKLLNPPTTAAPCAGRYTVYPGDSWVRIANAAGVELSALLKVNNARASTVIHPGDKVCLPAGARMPAPPTTTTVRPTTTVRRATATTKAPTTTEPRWSGSGESPEQVVALIRAIWPAELQERAIEIAWRESRWRPGVYNGWCCYGVFQIYWTVHRSWLANFGVTSSNQLLDARTNITMALEVYRRAGGWGPWGG